MIKPVNGPRRKAKGIIRLKSLTPRPEPEAGQLSVVTPLTYEPIGIAIPANDPLLMNWTTNTLNSIEASGTLDELRLKWFARGAWLDKLK